MKRGFALLYVLAITVILLLVVEAMLVLAHGTLRANVHDWELLRARRVSEMAADLAFCLLRDRDSRWFEEHSGSWSNTEFGPTYATERLRATFEITVVDRADVDREDEVFPNRGTYKLIRAVAQAGGRRAETLLTIKLTNPSINNMIVSEGTYQQRGNEVLTGPVLVSAEHSDGNNGDFQFVHTKRPQSYEMENEEVHFAGQIRAQGQVCISNVDHFKKPQKPPLVFHGTLKGTHQHDDLKHLPEDRGGHRGHVIFDEDCPSLVEPLSTGMPTIDELMGVYRRPDAGVTVVTRELDDPDGALVEFVDGEVVLSSVKWKQVGQCFDRSLYLDSFTSPGPNYLRQLTNARHTSNVREIMEAEVGIADPGFKNDNLPNCLTGHQEGVDLPDDMDGDGHKDKGDYFDVLRLVRKNVILRQPLNRNRWTVLYLTSNKYVHTDDHGETISDFVDRWTAPPLFVRGRVQGKVVVVYDVAGAPPVEEPLGDTTYYNRFHMYVHCEHEHASDSSESVGMLVPGGIHLADSTLANTPAVPPNASKDQVLLLCRGSIRGSGLAGRTLSHLVDGNHFVDYRAFLDDLDRDFADRYNDASYKLTKDASPDEDFPTMHFDGVGIAYRCQWRQNRVTAEGKVVVEGDERTRFHVNSPDRMRPWDEAFGGSLPDVLRPNNKPVLQGYMRHAFAPYASRFVVRGGLNSVGVPADVMGNVTYDYRWRDATADEIRDEICLPVGPVVMDKNQR